jgi:putative heme-binding domain-containing protein
MHVTSTLVPANLLHALGDKSPYVRAWAIQLSLDYYGVTEALPQFREKLVELAKKDPSPIVRLYLASALQRMKPGERWNILRELIAHGEDAADHNLPLMYWYAMEPLTDVDASRALHLANHAEIPLIQEFAARKIAMKATTAEALDVIVERLKDTDDAKKQLAFLRGMNEGLKGRRQAPMPANWPPAFEHLSVSTDKAVRDQAFALAVTFGDPKAFKVLRETLMDAKAGLLSRQNALDALHNARDRQLSPLLHTLLADAGLRGPALKALAAYDDSRTPAAILNNYASFSTDDKRAALNTLAARPAYGKALLDAIAAKKIPAADVSADIVRQLRNLGDADLEKQIASVWGVVRSSPADRIAAMKQYKGLVMKPSAVDLSLGRAVYAKTCASCHKLYGTGGDVGPDITGANRANLDYLLENVIDPSAVVPNEYAASLIAMKDGRVITGIIKSENHRSLTVATQNETLTLPRDEIEAMKPGTTSLMPDDQLKAMSEAEIRALFAYLMTPVQVPLLATPENAKDFFNGKDLAGWDGDPKLWKVENGEIVGTSPGIAKNEFLKSHMTADNFRLTLKVKLTPNKENSGIQFRSEVLPGGDVKGYQADIGAGWWGKLYEEHGRGILYPPAGINPAARNAEAARQEVARGGEGGFEQHVNRDGWNDYEIVAQGSRIKTFINGKPCVDLDDPKGARRGIFAVQIHSGGPMEVRFKELKLAVLK